MWSTSRISPPSPPSLPSPPSDIPPSIIVPTRRRFIGSLIALVAAPAIVRISSIMPVQALPVAVPILDSGPQEEFIGYVTAPVMIDGKFQPGKWKLFGVPTGRNFTTFDDDPGEPGEWKTYQGNWEAARITGLEGTKYRVEKVI